MYITRHYHVCARAISRIKKRVRDPLRNFQSRNQWSSALNYASAISPYFTESRLQVLFLILFYITLNSIPPRRSAVLNNSRLVQSLEVLFLSILSLTTFFGADTVFWRRNNRPSTGKRASTSDCHSVVTCQKTLSNLFVMLILIQTRMSSASRISR